MDIVLFAIRRSGNYYISEWLANNMVDGKFHELKRSNWGKYGIQYLYHNSLNYVINDHCIFEKEGGNGPKEVTYRNKYKYNFITIEEGDIDVQVDYIEKNRDTSRKIIYLFLVRDALNNLASIVNKKNVDLFNPAYKKRYCDYIKEGIGITNKCAPKVFINYNTFTKSKEYRDSIAKQIGVKNYDLQKKSGFSSFTGDGDYNTRYKRVQYPKNMIDILKDPEVSELTHKIFGMSTIQLLKES